MEERDAIIQKAVLEKLSNGPNFFSADDILAVARITESELKAIAESISCETARIEAKAQKQKPRKRH